MIVTTAQHRLAAVEGTNERPILVIQSEYQVEQFEWDMSEMLSALVGSLDEPGSANNEQTSGIQLLVTGIPGLVERTSRFDLHAGVVIEGSQTDSGKVVTNMTIPGEQGELVTIITTTEYHQRSSYHLLSPTN